MPTENALKARSNASCELCTSTEQLAVFPVPPTSDLSAQQCVYLCATCTAQINGDTAMDVSHWRCLNDSMIYMEDDVKTWAEQGIAAAEREGPTRDSNGTDLQDGDDVTLIKDLKVKGANFTAKQGTMVRGITLTDNPEHIEGKVNGTRIVLVSAYLKKA